MTLERPAPLYRQVYELLRRKILDGEFAPGESVQESRTAKMLRVSRTPVREALLQLEREGLLIAQGFERAVTNPTSEEFADLYICPIRGQILVVRRHLLSDAAVEDAICNEHATLLEAIRDGSVVEVQRCMKLHMNNDIQRLAGSGAS